MGNFMTNGIHLVNGKINLNKKIDLKNPNPKQKEEIISKESSRDNQGPNSSDLEQQNNITFSELLNISIYQEVKDRINNLDPEALSIMIAAKKRAKRELEYYKNTIKYIALALKPFYIVCLVSISIQSPELV